MKNTIWLWITSLYYTKSELIPLSLDEHQEIIASLQTHNALKAEEMVRKHITNVLERSLELSVFSPDGHFNINNLN
jgi:DNA-binding GntR family transcriptional regulator